jgi:hypothetical protein
VQDAHYFRLQADLYFELAGRMSLRQDAEYCRVTAERHALTAADLEKHSSASLTPSSGAQSNPENGSIDHDDAR